MLAWSEGIDNGRQKTRKSWLRRHCRRRAIYRFSSDHPRKLVTLNPKLKSARPDATSFFSCWWDAFTASSLSERPSESQDALGHCARLRSVALYLWLIVVISVRQSTVVAYLGQLPGAGYGQFEHKADSLIANSKKRAERSERLIQQSHRDYLRLVICIIVCLSWAVNHYRDNAITYKAQRDKNARELEAGERGNYWHADASAWCVAALDAKYTKELAGGAAKMMSRDDVAAGRRRADISSSVSQCVKLLPPPPAWIMQPPPDWQTPLNGIISPSERGWSLCKNNWKEPRSILMSSADRSCPYRWATHAIIVSTH